MKNGYEILWTNNALKELAQTFEYLELNFSEKELRKLSTEIEKIFTFNFSKSDSFFLVR